VEPGVARAGAQGPAGPRDPEVSAQVAALPEQVPAE